ncbi:COP1-interactive protein 1-like [Vicia villosa]|uniref:COP1-interactive protein 1-like n=1 Tax=Vicia villosa TaxID=3911 RepID=UPI00273B0DFC|nr:COP1-interactive protein 1-like [Vicia villosa]
MIKKHLRELSLSFGNQTCPENSQELRRTKTDIENNFSTVLQLIKSEGERQKEDNSRNETELEGLVEDIYNQYQSLDVPYDRLTRVYMKGAHRRIKRASSLSCCSLDSDYLSSDGTEFPDFSSRLSQRERYSPLVNTFEALETQKSTETNELEANEVRQIRAKNAELEKVLSELHEKLKNNEERAMSKTSDALNEEKVTRYRNEASKQKKEFTDKVNVMQQNLESVCNKNTDLESQLENQREKVSQYLIQIKNMEENLTETVSTKQNLLKEKECFIERIKELESQCSKEKDLEEQLRDLESLRNKNTDLESQLESQREKVSQYSIQIKNLEENLAETVSTKQNLLKEKQCFIERIKELESQCSKEKDLEEQLRDLESACNKNTDLEYQLENQREKVSQSLIRIKNLEENLAETVSTKQNLLKENQCFIERIKELESQCSKEKDLEEQLRDAMWEINALQKKKSELKLQNEQSQKEDSETIKKLTETIDLTHEENKHSKMNKQMMERKMERKMGELAEGIRQKLEDNIRLLHRRVHVAELLNNENKDTYKSTKQKYEEESKMFEEKIADYEDEIRMLREKVLKLEADMSMEGEKMNLMKTVTQLESKMMKLEKKLKEKDDELVSLGENKKEAIRQLCFLTEFHRDRCLYMKDLMLDMRIKKMK